MPVGANGRQWLPRGRCIGTAFVPPDLEDFGTDSDKLNCELVHISSGMMETRVNDDRMNDNTKDTYIAGLWLQYIHTGNVHKSKP